MMVIALSSYSCCNWIWLWALAWDWDRIARWWYRSECLVIGWRGSCRFVCCGCCWYWCCCWCWCWYYCCGYREGGKESASIRGPYWGWNWCWFVHRAPSTPWLYLRSGECSKCVRNCWEWDWCWRSSKWNTCLWNCPSRPKSTSSLGKECASSPNPTLGCIPSKPAKTCWSPPHPIWSACCCPPHRLLSRFQPNRWTISSHAPSSHFSMLSEESHAIG